MNNDDSPFASRREPAGIPASPIDLAIDRAVRKMMQLDPPAGLRRRVMARIESPPRRSFFVPAYGFAAAALAIVILGVWVARNNRVVPSSVEAPTAMVAEKAPAADTRIARAPQPDAAPPLRSERSVARRRPGFRREPIPMPPVADIFGARTDAIAAAADPTGDAVWTTPTTPDVEDTIAAAAPLVVSPVGVTPIATPPIVIAPIVVGRPPTAPPGPPR